MYQRAQTAICSQVIFDKGAKKNGAKAVFMIVLKQLDIHILKVSLDSSLVPQKTKLTATVINSKCIIDLNITYKT
jgi:hypothetical protein